MREAVAFHRLDLSGLTLFTEIGTRGFVTTPFIAAMGDAKHVYAITRDSVYGTASSGASFADRFAKFCEMEGRVEVVTVKTPATLGRADIVTNLGFVRPIDAETVDMMKPGVVVAMMCEGWEFRDDDLDLDACARRGVAVVETNEDYPGLTVFDFCGPLCVKLLLEAEIEVYKSQIVLVSSDKFGLIIEDCLRRNGAQVRRFARLSDPEVEGFLAAADALVIADYGSRGCFLGPSGQMTVERLREVAPGIVVIPFAGRVDAAALRRASIWCLPHAGREASRMSRTLAHLGVKPVVDLHCAGLKVAEIVSRHKRGDRDEDALKAALGTRGALITRGTHPSA
jgi:hypothetical protein